MESEILNTSVRERREVMTATINPLIILELEIQNIKRIIKVKIVPGKNVVEISGQNEAGKTTALDCIQLAIEGKKPFSGKKMLRNGQEKGKIKLTMGEVNNPLYIIERVFTKKGDYLKLSTSDGSTISKGQELLDTFYADNALELGNFVNESPQKQLDMLLKVVEIPFDPESFSKIVGEKVESNGDPLETINNVYEGLYREREDLGRRVRAVKGMFESISIPEGMEDTMPVDVGALIEEKERLKEIVSNNQKIQDARDALRDDLNEHKKYLIETRDELVALQKRIGKEEEIIRGITINLTKVDKKVESLVDPDFTEVDETIANANQINELASQVQRKKEATISFNKAQTKYDGYSRCLKDIKQYRLDILSKAEFPLKGMSISEEGHPTFDGVQISNKTISTSRGIKIETAIARKQNPKLRTILIRQGNDLDKNNLKTLSEFAQKTGWQIWIEKVKEEPDENCFFISNGELTD